MCLLMDQMVAVRGGRHPACIITFRLCNGLGTAQNKTNLSGSLICGSNAAGETLPLHIMFSSDDKEAQNHAVNTAWFAALP